LKVAGAMPPPRLRAGISWAWRPHQPRAHCVAAGKSAPGKSPPL